MISAELLSILQLTVVVALAATLVMLPPGWRWRGWLARSQSWLKAPIETLVTLPLVLPPVATGFLLRLLGRRGWFGAVRSRRHRHHLHVEGARHRDGRWACRSSCAVPAQVSSRARDASSRWPRRSAPAARVFLTISLPLARRSVLRGRAARLSARSASSRASMVIAGSIPGETRTVSLAIRLPRDGRDQDAATLAVASLVIAFVAV
jgi:molybdate transport system permease protein